MARRRPHARPTSRVAARASARGFSLLELMLVLAIIGILMAVAAVNVLGAGDRAKKRATQATLATIKTQINSYHLTYSSYPPDLRTLVVAKYLEDGKLRDGWGADLFYDSNGRTKDQPFYLGSAGPDKAVGNEDDIDVWRMNDQP